MKGVAHRHQVHLLRFGQDLYGETVDHGNEHVGEQQRVTPADPTLVLALANDSRRRGAPVEVEDVDDTLQLGVRTLYLAYRAADRAEALGRSTTSSIARAANIISGR
jgi:hypothetical protein